MPSTIVVEVRKALVEGIAGVTDDDVRVSYGYEGSDETRQRKQVFINRSGGPHVPTALRAGRNFRQETVELELVILVLGVGKKAEDTDEEALEIGLAVEEYIADRKGNQLDIDGLKWIQIDRFDLLNRFAPTGTISELTYTITYQARLE